MVKKDVGQGPRVPSPFLRTDAFSRGRRAISLLGVGSLLGMALSFCLLWNLRIDSALLRRVQEKRRRDYYEDIRSVYFSSILTPSSSMTANRTIPTTSSTTGGGVAAIAEGGTSVKAGLWSAFSAAKGGSSSSSGKRLLVFLPLLGTKLGPSHRAVANEAATVRTWASICDWARKGRWGTVEVVGMVEAAGFCDPALEAFDCYRCLVVPPICVHPTYHALQINCIFEEAVSLARQSFPPATLFFSNGDILFTPDVLDAISFVEDHFHPHGTNFTIVGRRIDLNMTAIAQRGDVTQLTLNDMLGLLIESSSGSRMHSPMGIDYFIMHPNAFPRDFPPFLIGRWKWDNALLYSLLKAAVPVVDGSDAILALHLGLHDATAKAHSQRPGADYNAELVNHWMGKAHLLGRIDNTPLLLVAEREVEDEEGRQLVQLKIKPRSSVFNRLQMTALRRAAPLPNTPSQAPFIVVLFVLPGQAHQALHWMCNARHHKLESYMVVTIDEQSHEALKPHTPHVILLNQTTTSPAAGAGHGSGPPLLHYNLIQAEVVSRLLRYNLTVLTSKASVQWSGTLLARLDLGTCDVTGLPPHVMVPPGPFVAVRPTSKGMDFWEDVLRCMRAEETKAERKEKGAALLKTSWDGSTTAESVCMGQIRDFHQQQHHLHYCPLNLSARGADMTVWSEEEGEDVGGAGRKRKRPWAVFDAHHDESLWRRGRGKGRHALVWDHHTKTCVGGREHQ